MMRYLFLLISSLFFNSQLLATHNLGGYISYKYLSGNTYEITVITVTEIGPTTAVRLKLPVNYGDNSLIDTIPRVFTEIIYDVPGRKIELNKYVTTHEYPGPGNYRISVDDPNRSAGINNVPNSVSTNFYIYADLNFISTSHINSSAIFNGLTFHTLALDSAFRYNPAAFDPEKTDHLTFTLQTPKINGGIDLPGYQNPGMEINPKTGELFWNSANIIGTFLFSVRASECRNDELISVFNFDFVVDVKPETTAPVFGSMSSWPVDTNGNYSIQTAPGQPVSLKVSFEDQVADSIVLEAYGAPFISGALFTDDSTDGNYTRRTFSWTPSAADHSCAPYIVSFRGSSFSNGIKYQIDRTLLVNVKDPNVNCNSPCYEFVGIEETEVMAVDVIAAPNPFREFTMITAKNKHLPALCIITLYDLQGRVTGRYDWETSSALKISSEGMRPGIYLMKVSDHNGIPLHNGKLVAH